MTVGSAWAGGSGLNVIVVVNQNSPNSLQLGNDYCEQRGVPPQNLLRMTNWTGGSINWATTDFTNDLLNPLLAMIASRGLTNQAQFVLLSMDIPYRVTDAAGDQNSTTAALFYGFKTNTAPVSGLASCSLPDATSNSYAYAEEPFTASLPNTASTNSFLAMMLTDTNLAYAENTLSNGVAGDSSFPTQTVCLAKTDDAARNVRFTEFDNSVFENQVVGNYAVTRINTDSTSFTNLFGLMTGLANLSLETNTFVPGAVGDSLTSYAGFILENSGQTPLIAFLEAGASGSYGTVVEPCNYTQKFPDPVDYFYQTRGFSLAEAYYQSILNPFQGLLVGEPLSAPFARRGAAAWTSLTNGTVLSGQAALTPVFTAAATNLPLAQVDLFVDGTFFQTLTNEPPAPGNVLYVTLNGHIFHYPVATNATVPALASGLAELLDAATNETEVEAFAVGDRVELQSLSVYLSGTNVTVSAGAVIGTASNLTTHLTATRPVFLDTVATGYQYVTVNNAPIVGDWLQYTFVKTNGVVVTLGVTNTTAGTTVGGLAQSLVNLINSTPALESADGLFAADFFDYDPYGQASVQFFLYPRTPGWPASQIVAELDTSTNLQATPTGMNPLADNVSDLRPRNHLYISSGTTSLPVSFTLNTTQLADGYHQLAAVGYEGTSVRTQTRVVRNIVVQNTGLTATLTALPAGTNAALNQQLQFSVTPNSTNISRIELFSTGGSAGVIANKAAATFTLPATSLGLGLHPFYALVTDQSGHRYQTQTVYYRIVPAIPLTLTVRPPSVSWPATIGRQYALQSTTNLAAGFQTLATITATNTVIQWPITTTGRADYYRVQLDR
jgi:uncharacterized protein (TIGR03790 family)